MEQYLWKYKRLLNRVPKTEHEKLKETNRSSDMKLQQ